MTTKLPDGYVSVAEAARLLGRGQETVRRWVRTGRIPAYLDHGDLILIPLEVIETPLRPYPVTAPASRRHP
jgi:excisionase family DNA binding protein